MSNDEQDGMIDGVRGHYHTPPDTPREEMWEAIAARIREPAGGVDLGEAKRRRSWRRAVWIPFAAAAMLAVGVGLGRVTAPVSPVPAATSAPTEGATPPAPRRALDVATREHLGRSESLLTIVRADAREGRIDPAAAAWARGLLSETRLLLDARGDTDPALDGLLEDLELVLMQIVGVARTGSLDAARTRTELDLALESLEAGEVLSRIRAELPAGLSGA